MIATRKGIPSPATSSFRGKKGLNIMGTTKSKELTSLYYFPECNGRARKGWVLHHKDVELKYSNPIRYAEWRIEDVIPMTVLDHHILHGKLKPNVGNRKLTENTKNKIRESLKGHSVTKEQREKQSAKMRGRTFNQGRKWYNNGVVNIFSKEMPLGEGWVKGQLRK